VHLHPSELIAAPVKLQISLTNRLNLLQQTGVVRAPPVSCWRHKQAHFHRFPSMHPVSAECLHMRLVTNRERTPSGAPLLALTHPPAKRCSSHPRSEASSHHQRHTAVDLTDRHRQPHLPQTESLTEPTAVVAYRTTVTEHLGLLHTSTSAAARRPPQPWRSIPSSTTRSRR
jgi:hypothetical protein